MSTHVHRWREKEYAVQMAASSIHFVPSATKEAAMEFTNIGAKPVEGLTSENIPFAIFDKVRTEPRDSSSVDAKLQARLI
ncbi:Fe-containing alcohol dehydrogenase [Penicillium chrysogenum]|uniref:Fe-containing alcohol dehydrogenase n=1 Tax=Penicillium chrysogenum TaxID=5076 RepID=A0ABQ8WDZ7_PENCH|nr:Fe-containing alcohol dehydrogenase [Penicillium chrysogenum]